jgi:hypothetical protein
MNTLKPMRRRICFWLLSEWEHPSVDEAKETLGGNMDVAEKKDIRMPKVKMIGIAEVNIRI